MANYLKMPKKSQVLALLELGWSYRRIEAETGVRRETVSRYDQARRTNAAKAFPGSDGWRFIWPTIGPASGRSQDKTCSTWPKRLSSQTITPSC